MITNRGRVKSKGQRNREELEILNPIRDRFKTLSFDRSGESIKLPEYVNIHLLGSTLIIDINTAKHPKEGKGLINPACDNMQNDASAFEAWAICIKTWLPDKVKDVHLKWIKPDTTSKEGHYNRFLYRVMKFAEWYDWFSYDEGHNDEIAEIRKILSDSTNNSSSKEAQRKTNTRFEEQIEYDLMHVPDNRGMFSKVLDCSECWHHLPVGVKDKGGKSIFTGGQSAIDLWGLGNNGSLVLVELKYNKKYRENKETLNNIKIGIISELMFYCNVMNDIRLGKIKRPNSHILQEIKLYKETWHAVEGVMMATDYHPLLYKVEEIKSLLNSNNVGINFSMYEYQWDMNQDRLLYIQNFNPL